MAIFFLIFLAFAGPFETISEDPTPKTSSQIDSQPTETPTQLPSERNLKSKDFKLSRQPDQAHDQELFFYKSNDTLGNILSSVGRVLQLA